MGKSIIEPMTPSEGMVLTNGETYSSEVYLGKNDSPDNWWEITKEEHERLIAEQEREGNTDDEL